LQSHYQTFQDAGTEVVALVMASIGQVEGWCKNAKVNYPMLADSEHQVSAAYSVYNLLGDGLAAPAVFVVDTDGRIVWSYVGQHSGDRVSAQTILEHLP
jgi:peroxiredoxin